MLIYSIIGNSLFGEKLWDNGPKKPTKIGALKQEISPKRERKSEFTSTLTERYSRVCVMKVILSLNYSTGSGGRS
jgi:hypothetical protein